VVKIRLQKLGRRNRSYFRIVATDARTKRQGIYLENLGTYDPIEKVAEKAVVVNTERVKHWVGQGAQATDAVVSLLRKRGVQFLNKPMKPKKKKTPAKAAPKAAAKK
jgi:small subunit ribosomal protein S16